MELLLSKGEEIVKTWEYGEKKAKGLFSSKKNNVKRSLIVTNKRIVSQSQGANTTARKEIPLSSADYVTSSFTKKQLSFIPAIVAAVFGLILLIVGLVIKGKDEYDKILMPQYIFKLGFIALGAILLIVAIVLLILFFVNRSAGVEIIIAGKCLETQLMNVASSNLAKAKKAKLFKIIVNKEIAFTMINELGAILLDLKQTSEQ